MNDVYRFVKSMVAINSLAMSGVAFSAIAVAADVVTFNQVTDIELLRKNGLVCDDWQKRLLTYASPYCLQFLYSDAGLGGWEKVTATHFGAGGILEQALLKP